MTNGFGSFLGGGIQGTFCTYKIEKLMEYDIHVYIYIIIYIYICLFSLLEGLRCLRMFQEVGDRL